MKHIHKMSVIKVSSIAHNDGYLVDRLAESLQQLKRLNSGEMMLPGQQQSSFISTKAT